MKENIPVLQMSFELHEPHARAGCARVRHYHPRVVRQGDLSARIGEEGPFVHCSDLSCCLSEYCLTQKSRGEQAEEPGKIDRGENEIQGLLVVTVDNNNRQPYDCNGQFRRT